MNKGELELTCLMHKVFIWDVTMILVSGAAGFIGSNFDLDLLKQSNKPVVNLDILTFAGNLENLKELEGDLRYQFVFGNIGDRKHVSKLLADNKPRTDGQRYATQITFVHDRSYAIDALKLKKELG